MRKKSNKFPVCESCGRDAHGGTDPNWKPPPETHADVLRDLVQWWRVDEATSPTASDDILADITVGLSGIVDRAVLALGGKLPKRKKTVNFNAREQRDLREACSQKQQSKDRKFIADLKKRLEACEAQLEEANQAFLNEQTDHRRTDEQWNEVFSKEREKAKKLTAEYDDITKEMRRDVAFLREENKELAKRLDYEQRRAAQALEVADNAAIGTACIARITNRLSCVADTLETRIEQSNDALGKLLKTTKLSSFRDKGESDE